MQVHQRTTDLKVLREVVLPVHAEHRLALHAIVGIRLERSIHIGMRVDDALVDDGHLASRIIDGIVGTLLQLHTTSGDLYRPSGDIGGAQREDTTLRTFVGSRHDKLIALSILFGYRLGRVVELSKGVLVSLDCRKAVVDELLLQVAAKGLGGRQEHPTIADCITLDKVEVTIGVGLVVIVQTVATQQLDQRLALHPLVGDISEIHTCGIALVLDVEAELGLLDRRSQIIHVFHHQAPVALRGIVRRVFQRLHEEGFRGLCQIAGKLTHLIGNTTRGKLKGYRQYLVGLESRLQRDIT